MPHEKVILKKSFGIILKLKKFLLQNKGYFIIFLEKALAIKIWEENVLFIFGFIKFRSDRLKMFTGENTEPF